MTIIILAPFLGAIFVYEKHVILRILPKDLAVYPARFFAFAQKDK